MKYDLFTGICSIKFILPTFKHWGINNSAVLKIVPNRQATISVIMPCMFPTFIFCLLFTTLHYSSPAHSAAVQVVFDVSGSRVGESDAWRNINGRKCLCEIDQRFSASLLAASRKQWLGLKFCKHMKISVIAA